jgi:purine-cytosine permease-like protein
MTAIGIGWGITWLAYASDYSRFVSPSMPKRKLYLASVLGQFIPVVWLGVLGASVATIGKQADPGQLIVTVFGALAIPVLLLVIHGPIATNILNIYSCALCALTVDLKVSRRNMAYLVGAFASAFTIVLIFQESFAHALDGWLASLVVWVAPWASIMAVHYYLVRRQQVDIDALYDAPGRSRLGDIRWDAMVSFLVGIFATWFFEFGIPTALQGPGAKMLGNVDISWLAGGLTAGVLYAVFARRSAAARSRVPVGAVTKAE